MRDAGQVLNGCGPLSVTTRTQQRPNSAEVREHLGDEHLESLNQGFAPVPIASGASPRSNRLVLHSSSSSGWTPRETRTPDFSSRV